MWTHVRRMAAFNDDFLCFPVSVWQSLSSRLVAVS